MKICDEQQVNRKLSFPALIEALDAGFRQDFGMPQRQVYTLAPKTGGHDAFAVLPAWNEDVIGVKAFTYFPDNAAEGYPLLSSKILLFGRQHGAPLAMVDGTSVTYWRTAAVSALAARYLARQDASTLLLLGTGHLAQPLADAHLSVRALRRVLLWGRDGAKAEALRVCLQLRHRHVQFALAHDLAAAAGEADIIVCATGSPVPLLHGDWVGPGTHVDLLGNHSPGGRECDSALIVKADVYVDSRQNVLNEAGELLIPIGEGVFSANEVRAELSELCRAAVFARRDARQVTVFKSVGTALADLIAAHMVAKG